MINYGWGQHQEGHLASKKNCQNQTGKTKPEVHYMTVISNYITTPFFSQIQKRQKTHIYSSLVLLDLLCKVPCQFACIFLCFTYHRKNNSINIKLQEKGSTAVSFRDWRFLTLLSYLPIALMPHFLSPDTPWGWRAWQKISRSHYSTTPTCSFTLFIRLPQIRSLYLTFFTNASFCIFSMYPNHFNVLHCTHSITSYSTPITFSLNDTSHTCSHYFLHPNMPSKKLCL